MPGIKSATPIETSELCSHGCGHLAKYINKSKKFLCCEYSNSCPAVKKKNSLALSKAHKDGKMSTDHLDGHRAWNKGRTKHTDERVLSIANTQRGVRRISDEQRIKRIEYYEKCKFDIQHLLEKIEGYELLVKHGMYDRLKNPSGVVRDHIVSIAFGFKNDIDPKIISHPANCRFVLHKENARKSSLNGFTLNELYDRIDKWDREGNWYTLLNESQQSASSNLADPTIYSLSREIR